MDAARLMWIRDLHGVSRPGQTIVAWKNHLVQQNDLFNESRSFMTGLFNFTEKIPLHI
jgi:hypothetical protein